MLLSRQVGDPSSQNSHISWEPGMTLRSRVESGREALSQGDHVVGVRRKLLRHHLVDSASTLPFCSFSLLGFDLHLPIDKGGKGNRYQLVLQARQMLREIGRAHV